MNFSPELVQHCIVLLRRAADDPDFFASLGAETIIELQKVAGELTRPDRHIHKARRKAIQKIKEKEKKLPDRATRAATGIRQARLASVFTAPEQLRLTEQDNQIAGELKSPRACYVCKESFTKVHVFYDALCPKCAAFNYAKRFQTADLSGQIALITGSRLKIGYQATLMLLRAGAKVIATTRFPVDSALRFAKEKDYADWKDRLHIYGLDLRHIPSVELFTHYIEQTYPRLDVLINNAAQTVRRPTGFYAHMIPLEKAALSSLHHEAKHLLERHELLKQRILDITQGQVSGSSNLPVAWNAKAPAIGIRASAELSQIPYSFDHSISSEEVFPAGKLDADLQQVDLRNTNSWRLRLGEVPTMEMLEVQLVNSVAPFTLINGLIHLMRRENTGMKHIINVSAMEGKFQRWHKEDRHPHTNMAKAALNMMTHTSASDFAKDGIYMNAVDTGWVTDEDPVQLARFKEEHHDFQPPLDIVDGAARVLDPLFDGIQTGTHWCGKFLKDYFPIDW